MKIFPKSPNRHHLFASPSTHWKRHTWAKMRWSSNRGVENGKCRPLTPTAWKRISPGPEARARTVPVEEIPEWQQDNKYIIRGYRLAKADYVEVFTSLTFLHNETCNVYSHLIGALLLPIIAAVFLWSLSATRFHNVLATDYVMFAFFFCCAECCLGLQHTLSPLRMPLARS